jgi:hypothetical protein
MAYAEHRGSIWKRATALGVATLGVALATLGCGAAAPVTGDADSGANANGQSGWSARAPIAGVDLGAIWGSGADIFAAGKGPLVARSGDGGKSWNTVDLKLGAGEGWPSIRHIAGSSGADVWLVGDLDATTSVLLHSADRGLTWQTRDPGSLNNVQAVWALDAQRVLLASRDGGIARSVDGGAHFTIVEQVAGASFFGLWSDAAGDSYAVGGWLAPDAGDAGTPGPPDGGDNARPGDGCDGGVAGSLAAPGARLGLLLRSTDAGASWTPAPVSVQGVLWNVWGTPDGRAVVAAGAGATVAGTFDHGVSWVTESRPASGLALTDVWVGPGDGSLFYASDGGLIRDVLFDCNGSMRVVYEPLPPAPDASRATAAIWGSSSGDVWAVGPGGAIRHRP